MWLLRLFLRRQFLLGSVNVSLLVLNLFFWCRSARNDARGASDRLPGDAYGVYDVGHGRPRLKSAPMGITANLDPSVDPKAVNQTLERAFGRKNNATAAADFPVSDAYITPANMKDFKSPAQARDDYRVPRIKYTDLVNCALLLKNDSKEVRKAKDILAVRPKVPIYEETYQEWTRDCAKFKQMRGYVQVPLSRAEEAFPLAFSIAMYTDVEQTERLLRAIYQPQNLYCVHIDIKASMLVHNTMRAISNCFDNVWISTHLDKIKWGDVSVLLPEINCMRDLVRYRRGKWKYFINLTGQEFPLRTNYEIVQIGKIFNGSNDIGGSAQRMDLDRVKYHWTHRWSKTYQQTIFYNTFQPKSPAPYNITFYKGELHGLFSRRMVEFLVESDVAQRYLEWCWDSGHPSEHYWNALNYNVHLKAPGGYQGPLDLAHNYSSHLMIRAKHWVDLYDDRVCRGKIVRGICIYGIDDVTWLATRPELFANKFHLTYHYLGMDCLEERHRNRTMLKDKFSFDSSPYIELPTVKYGRKDGL